VAVVKWAEKEVSSLYIVLESVSWGRVTRMAASVCRISFAAVVVVIIAVVVTITSRDTALKGN
jgi:hypothetical protein